MLTLLRSFWNNILFLLSAIMEERQIAELLQFGTLPGDAISCRFDACGYPLPSESAPVRVFKRDCNPDGTHKALRSFEYRSSTYHVLDERTMCLGASVVVLALAHRAGTGTDTARVHLLALTAHPATGNRTLHYIESLAESFAAVSLFLE